MLSLRTGPKAGAGPQKCPWYNPVYVGIPAPLRTPVRNDSASSLLAEGLAVSALIHGGICLMGAYQDPLQRAKVGILAVMGALLDSTLNALVCMTIHR